MCDTTSNVSFFRPWNNSTDSAEEVQIKNEFSGDDAESENEMQNDNHCNRTCTEYQPLDVLSELVNQTTTNISRTECSSSSPQSTDMIKIKESNRSSAFIPFEVLLNSDPTFLPSLRNYMPFSYNPELISNPQGLITMDCFNHYAAKLQGEVNLLQQQDLAVKQMKKLRPKKYKCEYCDNAFSNKGQLKGHTRIHTGERPYKCENPSCGKTFTRNEELTRHKKIHTGEKPHKCPCCNKCFGRKDHLKKHAKTHEKGSYNFSAPYQFSSAIPYIATNTYPQSPINPIAVPYMYPFV